MNGFSRKLGSLLGAMFFFAACGMCHVFAESADRESFESPETTWKVAESDCRPLRLVAHQRVFDVAHGGRGSEHLEINAGQGTFVYLSHSTTPARIIHELKPSLWLKSDRHGLQLLARVVFPRSLENGKPVTSFLPGDTYEAINSWRLLRVDDVLRKLQQEAARLRTQFAQIDEREAYIDMLVLNAYTGPGPTKVWIDDLELVGFAAATVGKPPAGWTAQSDLPTSATHNNEEAIQRDGNILLADGRPIFVRAIERRGETLAFLQSLGFNCVCLAGTPSEADAAEAKSCGIWLIAPQSVSTAAHPRVLGWHLGEQLTSRDLPLLERRAKQPTLDARPLVATVARGLSQFRAEAFLPLLDRSTVGTSFDQQDFAAWLTQTARNGPANAAFWAAVPTELPIVLRDQAARLGTTREAVLAPDPDQVRLLAFAAIASGARGLWFRSATRLDGQDLTTRMRAATVRQVNRELELVAPWAAAGTTLGEQATNNPRIRVLGMQTERAKMFLVLPRKSDQQISVAAVEATAATIELHGGSVSERAYFVRPSGIEPVASQRGGGLRLSLSAQDVVSCLLVTQDPLAVNYAGRTASAIASEVSAARHETLGILLAETERVERALSSRNPSHAVAASRLAEANAKLRQSEALAQNNDHSGSLRACEAVANLLREIRRSRWEQAVLSFPSPASSPLCLHYSTLPAHFALGERLKSWRWGVNLLAAGEMENLEHVLNSGWKQSRGEISGVSADVQLSLEAPHAGRSALQLRAWRSDQAPVQLDGETPIVITSAPIPVRNGQLLRVHGWAQSPRPLDSSWDGLMLFDSQTGPDLAERIFETRGWREFTLYRVATRDGDWRLTICLTGLGEAWLDDLSVTTLDESAATPFESTARLPRGPMGR